MVATSRVASVFLRIWELICACVVVGLIGTYLSYLGKAHVTSGRMNYVIATASLGIVCSLALGPPFKYSFWAFPIDLAMFVMWMVAFGVMIDVSTVMVSTPTLNLTASIAHWDRGLSIRVVLEQLGLLLGWLLIQPDCISGACGHYSM
jgi:hypothetical protein